MLDQLSNLKINNNNLNNNNSANSLNHLQNGNQFKNS